MAAAKRPRTSSSSSSSLATNPELPQTTSASPPHKASRIHPLETRSPTQLASTTTTTTGANDRGSSSRPIVCNLPPTCQSRPTPISSTIELERHYAKFHAHVCEFDGCGCVFPEERFLELHQTECHDPIAALQKERNEKIFECFVAAPACGRKFSAPKTRRLHLIQAHSFPKQYFFAVTNKGIGGLLKKWGEGASLIRKEWKPRERGLRDQIKMQEDDDDDDHDSIEDNALGVDPEITDDDDDDDDGPAAAAADLDATPRIRPRKMLSPTATSQAPSSRGAENTKSKHNNVRGSNNSQQGGGNVDIAGLTQSLNALSLVPNSVRFGRGGKTAGFASGGGRPVKRNSDDIHHHHHHTASAGSGIGRSSAMEVDGGQVDRGGPPRRGRGRGGRGRGF